MDGVTFGNLGLLKILKSRRQFILNTINKLNQELQNFTKYKDMKHLTEN